MRLNQRGFVAAIGRVNRRAQTRGAASNHKHIKVFRAKFAQCVHALQLNVRRAHEVAPLDSSCAHSPERASARFQLAR